MSGYHPCVGRTGCRGDNASVWVVMRASGGEGLYWWGSGGRGSGFGGAGEVA